MWLKAKPLTDGTSRRDARYELKYVTDAVEEAHIRTLLNLHPYGVSQLFEDRTVHSLYLDTPTNDALHENLTGLSHREKWRLRWYGEGVEDVKATLERKVRDNTLGWKDLYPLPHAIDMSSSVESLMTQLLEWFGDALLKTPGVLRPTQWISYKRSYLTTIDRRLRITLDRQLRCYDQRGHQRLQNRFETPSRDLLILEVKYMETDHDYATRFLSGFPITRGRCSKYVIASSPIDGPLL